MQSKNLDQFNARLSQWVASQGFWFHLRHSIGSSAIGGSIAYHCFQIMLRLSIFILLLGVGVFYYLFKRAEGESFRNDLRTSVTRALGVEELAMSGDRQNRGQLEITRFAAEGGPDSFFEFFEARNLTCQMGLLDGVIGTWDTGTITINRFDARIRAGTDTPKDSANIGRLIFRQFEKVIVNNIEIKSASIGWGYSERTRGGIEDSQISLQRIGGDWRVVLRGGVFYQNWLRGLEIIEIIAICTPEGIQFEKAVMQQKSGGTLDFTGVQVAAGHEPTLSGTVRARMLDLAPLLPESAANILEGQVSANFTLSGSTNSSGGIALDGLIRLDEAHTITVRDDIPLLRALSIIDQFNTYRRLDFNQGSFRLATHNGTLRISEIAVRAGNLATLQGGFIARPPTQAEIDAIMLNQPRKSEDSSIFGTVAEDPGTTPPGTGELEERFTRRETSDAGGKDAKAAVPQGDGGVYARIEDNYEVLRLAQQHAARLARMVVYEGEIKMTFPANAFDRTELLRKAYPVDPQSGRIPMDIKLSGTLDKITRPDADRIYELGRH
jgi:hypothetical protein